MELEWQREALFCCYHIVFFRALSKVLAAADSETDCDVAMGVFQQKPFLNMVLAKLDEGDESVIQSLYAVLRFLTSDTNRMIVQIASSFDDQDDLAKEFLTMWEESSSPCSKDFFLQDNFALSYSRKSASFLRK